LKPPNLIASELNLSALLKFLFLSRSQAALCKQLATRILLMLSGN
jgi:hypothetical protein